MQLEAADWSIQATPPVHLQGFTPYYRWRQEFGGMKVDQARRFKELEKENARLKRAVANLTVDKLILEEATKGNF